MIEFKGSWDTHLALMELVGNIGLQCVGMRLVRED